MRAALVLLVASTLAAGACRGPDREATPASSVALPGLTPRPTPEQAEQLEGRVAGIYPGVPAGKATDWAVSTCRAAREGRDPVSWAQQMFAGGTRADPTEDQAEAIVAAIAAAGFCPEI